MDDALLEELAQKAGGRFKLASLLQKRVRELLFGSPKLTETRSSYLMDIALDEIHAGLLSLKLPEIASNAGQSDEKESEQE